MTRRSFQLVAALATLTATHTCIMDKASAQRTQQAVAAEEEHSQWYYGSEEKPQKSIAQQKSELRAEQRMDRLASLRWYGFTPGRPTATGMTFTTMYSPAWTRPGGQPFAWYTGYQQPVVNNVSGWRYW